MNEGLESLNDLAKSVGNLDGGPILMRDCLEEWFCLEPLRRKIAKMISKASTNRTNQPIKLTIDWSIPTDQVIKNDSLARPATLAKAETNQEAIN